MKTQHVRVLLADDHDVVRAGVRAMLEAREGWHICAEASNGPEAVKLAAEMQPDVAVLDLELGGLDGLAATREIKRQYPQIEILIFTIHDDEYLIRDGLSAGARAFVLKSEGGQRLIKAIEDAMEERSFTSAKASETILYRNSHARTYSEGRPVLTDREREIVQLLVIGRSNKEAAQALGISVKTIETHRAAIMRKLGLGSIVSLVRYAVRERLISA